LVSDIVGGGEVELYVTESGQARIIDQSEIDKNGYPADFRLYGDVGSQISIDDQNSFYGIIYAPQGQVMAISDQTHIYGSIVGKTIHIGDQCHVHRDLALADLDWGSGGLTCKYWEESPFGEEV